MDPVTVVINAPLEDLKDQVKDKSEWRKSFFVVVSS